MHYYQFNIGDYIKHTNHLGDDEDLAYRRLLDFYYDTEQPIPKDIQKIARRIKMNPEVVQTILEEFFVNTDEGYRNYRADQEISDYHGFLEKQKANGLKGGKPKKNGGLLVANPTESQNNPKHSQQPLNTNHIKDMSATGLPTCPHEEIISLYVKNLPQLTKPRVWEGSRAINMRSRWIQASKPSTYSPNGYLTKSDGLAWWDAFFAYIANDTSLATGFSTKDRTWKPDLEWIVNANNFAKIIDGKYNK